MFPFFKWNWSNMNPELQNFSWIQYKPGKSSGSLKNMGNSLNLPTICSSWCTVILSIKMAAGKHDLQNIWVKKFFYSGRSSQTFFRAAANLLFFILRQFKPIEYSFLIITRVVHAFIKKQTRVGHAFFSKERAFLKKTVLDPKITLRSFCVL